MCWCIGIAFGLVALLFLDPILYFFGASEATIGYAREYMTVILLGNVVTHMYLGLNSVLRASGHPRKSMYATINTVVINTILDPLFIFGFGWGIRGAAIATVLAQVISLVWQLASFRTNRSFSISAAASTACGRRSCATCWPSACRPS